MGIDTSNLPKGSKLIFHTPAKVTCREYKIGRFNVPKSDPMCSKRPVRILESNPIMPSFARFYLESKFCYNLSENRILEMLKGMKTNIPQSSLNLWMHQIMEMLRERLEPLMLEAIRQSKFTNNDAILINALFYIERVFLQEDDQSPEHRLEFRKEWSEPIVDRIMEMLKKMRAAGDEYGQMVHRAVDYILDDEDAFRTFLSDGRIDMHNIAIERCFRHIAMGRRNWLQTGSHFSAQNLAFMFGLLESCKLNKVNFGEYIEDILTRILCGEEVDASFLPCDYVRHFEDGTDAEVTKTSQAVA